MITLPGRISITVFPLFWILIFLLGWLSTGTVYGTLIWASVILFSVLVHEMGHALTAVAFGQKAEIEFVAFGGLTKRSGPPLSALKEFIIVLNGPLAGFSLFIAAYVLHPFVVKEQFSLLADVFDILILVNLFWTLLNLVPVLPLDGGQLLRIVLQGSFGLRGVKFTYLFSVIVAVLLGVYFFITQLIFAGAIFLMLAFESYRAFSDMKGIAEHDDNPDLHELLKAANDEWRSGQFEEAAAKLKFLKEKTKSGKIFDRSSVVLGRVFADGGNIEKAYAEVSPLISHLSQDDLRILQHWAYQLQKWDAVIEIGKRSYELEPSGQVALSNAIACTHMDHLKPAIGWLKCAQQFDIPNFEITLKRKEFDTLRSLPEFQAFLL